MDINRIVVLTTNEEIIRNLSNKGIILNKFQNLSEENLIIIADCDNQELINNVKYTKAFKIFITDKEQNIENVNSKIIVLEGTIQGSINSIIDSLTSIIGLEFQELRDNIQGNNIYLITPAFNLNTLDEKLENQEVRISIIKNLN